MMIQKSAESLNRLQRSCLDNTDRPIGIDEISVGYFLPYISAKGILL